MKKLLKRLYTKILAMRNLKFVVKQYASKYLRAFLAQAYSKQVQFITKKISNLYHNFASSQRWSFILKIQSQRMLNAVAVEGVFNVRKLKCCSLTGRARGLIARFQLARTIFRKLINVGCVPGERKMSF